MRRGPIAAVTALAILAGCGGSGAAPTAALPNGRHADGKGLTAAVKALCDSSDQARRDPAAAASTFYLRSHTELHVLAQALGLTDRIQAAQLLEGMYTVEQDMAATPARPALAADLSALGRLAGSGLTTLRLPTPSCTTRTKL